MPAAPFEDLLEKLKAKYDVAKFLLGAFVVNAGLILNTDVLEKATKPDEKHAAFAGVMLLLLGLGLAVATLFAYDALRMPPAFWGSDGASRAGTRCWTRRGTPSWTVKRPPSQKHLVLYYDMVHVWRCFFLPSLLVSFAAVSCFLYVLVRNNFGWTACSTALGVGGGAMFALVVVYTWYVRNQPALGVED